MLPYWNNSYYIILAIQVVCILHVLKTGRSREWLYLLIFLPLVGAIVYFFREILPGLRNNTSTTNISNVIFPNGRIKELERNLRISDTDANRLNLAAEYARLGKYDKAIDLTKSCLTGIYANDPGILRDLATYYALNEQYADSVTSFKRVLAVKNSKFDRPEDELAYAKALDDAGFTAEAEEEYKKIIRIHHSVEAMYRYGLLLKKQGNTNEANAQFKNAIDQRELNPGYVRRTIAPWVNASRRELRRQ
jgi:hypothetical protein